MMDNVTVHSEGAYLLQHTQASILLQTTRFWCRIPSHCTRQGKVGGCIAACGGLHCTHHRRCQAPNRSGLRLVQHCLCLPMQTAAGKRLEGAGVEHAVGTRGVGSVFEWDFVLT